MQVSPFGWAPPAVFTGAGVLWISQGVCQPDCGLWVVINHRLYYGVYFQPGLRSWDERSHGVIMAVYKNGPEE